MKNPKNLFVSVFLICFMLFLDSCTHNINVPDLPAVSFSKDVLPILIGNCDQATCHSSSASAELFPLDNYQDVMQYGEITPHDALSSNLYKSVSGRGLVSQMPPDKPLAEADLQTIFLWIQQGAKNN